MYAGKQVSRSMGEATDFDDEVVVEVDGGGLFNAQASDDAAPAWLCLAERELPQTATALTKVYRRLKFSVPRIARAEMGESEGAAGQHKRPSACKHGSECSSSGKIGRALAAKKDPHFTNKDTRLRIMNRHQIQSHDIHLILLQILISDVSLPSLSIS